MHATWQTKVFVAATPISRPARVNSVHHQGLRTLGRGLVVEASSVPDGVVEAVRYAPGDDGGPFAYGVQWHPEFIAPGETSLLDPQVLLAGFLEETRKARRTA